MAYGDITPEITYFNNVMTDLANCPAGDYFAASQTISLVVTDLRALADDLVLESGILTSSGWEGDAADAFMGLIDEYNNYIVEMADAIETWVDPLNDAGNAINEANTEIYNLLKSKDIGPEKKPTPPHRPTALKF